MICEKCGKEFNEDWRRDKETRKKPCRFCSRECANSRVMSVENRKKISTFFTKNEKRFCSSCGKGIQKRVKGSKCKECISLNFGKITKGELFSCRKGYQSARSTIRKNAYNIYFIVNKKEYKCEKCGYTKYVEVAHIKPVSKFSSDVLVSEINSISNLIGLCPNCHWEYDNK